MNINEIIEKLGAPRGHPIKGKKYPKMSEAGKELWKDPKYKKRMKKAHKGQHSSPKTEFKKGQIAPNKGKKLNAIRGEKHWNWKGGKSPRGLSRVEYKEWRTKVFQRDNYICQISQQRGELEAHHIKSWAKFPKLRYEVDNGVTLSKDWHKKIRGKIIWISGNSGSGKTTLAKKLLKLKYAVHIDGDSMRRSISADLGFSKKDRIENNLRIARLAKVIKDQGFDVIISTICPFRDLRKKVKEITKCKFIYLMGGKTGKDYPYEYEEDKKYFKKTG